MGLFLGEPESQFLYASPTQHVQESDEVNLQPLWPSYPSHKQVYCRRTLLVFSKVCTQFQEKKPYTYLAKLDATFIGSRGTYTIREKASCTLQTLHETNEKIFK